LELGDGEHWDSGQSQSGDAPSQPVVHHVQQRHGPRHCGDVFRLRPEHTDVTLFPGAGTSTAATRRDIAFDNDNLVYDEYYATAQAAGCTAGTQVGQVAFDQLSYGTCPTSSAVLSVADANGVSGMTVTVTSPGTGDSEVVTLTGSAPYFSAR